MLIVLYQGILRHFHRNGRKCLINGLMKLKYIDYFIGGKISILQMEPFGGFPNEIKTKIGYLIQVLISIGKPPLA